MITRYGADDFRDFLDLVEWDLNLNDLLDVPDLRELDDLLDRPVGGNWRHERRPVSPIKECMMMKGGQGPV